MRALEDAISDTPLQSKLDHQSNQLPVKRQSKNISVVKPTEKFLNYKPIKRKFVKNNWNPVKKASIQYINMDSFLNVNLKSDEKSRMSLNQCSELAHSKQALSVVTRGHNCSSRYISQKPSSLEKR